jgi:hypothetical protein
MFERALPVTERLHGVHFAADGGVSLTDCCLMSNEVHRTGMRHVRPERLTGDSVLLSNHELLLELKGLGILSPSMLLGRNGIVVHEARADSGVLPEAYLSVGNSRKPECCLLDATQLKGKVLDPSIPVESVNVLTGICMFGFAGYRAELEDGSQIPVADRRLFAAMTQQVRGFQVDPQLSVYEKEGMQRIARSIGLLLDGTNAHVEVNIHVPREEYVLYAMRAYEKGLLSKELLREHMGNVDARADLIENTFSGLVQAALPPVTIKFASPLRAARAFVHQTIEQDATTFTKDRLSAEFIRLCEELRSNPHWAVVMPDDFAAKQTKSRNLDTRWFDLNYLSYTQALLAVAYCNGSEQKVGLQIDDHVERTIADAAASKVGPDSNYRFAGIFAHSPYIRVDERALDAHGWRPFRWPSHREHPLLESLVLG